MSQQRLALVCAPQKSAAEIEAEQEAKLAQKYGGLAKKKLMPKVSRPTSAL